MTEPSLEPTPPRERTTLHLKHWGSCLPDQSIVVDIATEGAGGACIAVSLSVDTFDSSLIEMLVCDILPQQHGIKAFRDDNVVVGGAWITKPAECMLFIRIGDQSYRSQVVKLFGGRGVAVTLEPQASLAEPPQ